MSQRSFTRAQQRKAAAAAIGATALFAPAAHAATFQVTTLADGAASSCTEDTCTLRAAVVSANNTPGADTITFAGALSGAIALDAEEGPIGVMTGDDLTIAGPGADRVQVDGGGATQLFSGDGTGGSLTISGLGLRNGRGARGAAVDMDTSAPLTLTADVISGNVGTTNAGAVRSAGPVTITGSTFTANQAATSGGAVALSGSAPLTVSGSTFTGNRAEQDGGALDAGGSTTVTGSTLSGNTAGDSGGALHAQGVTGFVRVRDSLVAGNAAAYGGGLGLDVITGAAGPSDVTGTTISGNHATFGGGGVAVRRLDAGARLRIAASTISGNDAADADSGTAVGGGLLADGPVRGTLQLRESTVSGNRAAVGAGISLRDAGLENGAAVRDDGAIDLENSTVAANAATVSGGGIALDSDQGADGGPASSTIGLTSSVVADNTAAGAPQDLDREDDTTGGGLDARFSLVEAPGDAPLLLHPAAPSIVGIDPQLGPLASNGGPTQTQRPATSSPLLDQGHAPIADETDQRGSARTYDAAAPNPDTGDGTDIGAVELAAAEFPGPIAPPTAPVAPPAPPAPGPQQFFATVAGKPLTTRGPAGSLRTVVASLPGVTCSVSRDTIRRCTVAVRSTAAVRVPGRTAPLPKGTLLAAGSSSAAGSVASLLVKVKLTSAGAKVLATRPLGVVGGATVNAVTSAGTPQVQAAVRLLRSNSIRILVPGRPTTLPRSVTTQIDAAARVFRSAITVECSAYSDAPRNALTLTTLQAKLACARVAKLDVDATLTPRGHSASHRLAPAASAARRALSRRIVLRFGL